MFAMAATAPPRVPEHVIDRALTEAGFGDAFAEPPKPKVWAGVLGEVPPFSQLAIRDLCRIAEAAKVVRAPAGRPIVRESFTAEGFYVLLTGSATVHRPGGQPVQLSRGDFFGELGLIDAAPRTATVVADTDLWLVKLPRDRFFELIDRRPTIARGLLEELARRIRRLESERSS